MMDSPLPPLPPTVVPRRKPVGSGLSLKSQPSPPSAPQPYASGDISPVESIGSLLSAYYGEEDSSDPRNSVETAATKYSSFEPSPPKVLPKDHLAGASTKLDLVSPLALPTPVASNTMRPDHPPTPPTKDSHVPTTPKTSKSIAQRTADLLNKSPPSQSSPSPSQPQLLRRRSLKSDKPLTLPELKLTTSHGSTSSSQQVLSSLNSDQPDLAKPNAPFAAKTGVNSPMRNGFSAFPGRNIRPSPSQKALPRSPQPPPPDMGNKGSKEPLDGFSQYAQEIENRNLSNPAAAPQYSPAKMSPETRRPPTPEYSKHDHPSGQPAFVSPASPMTPPDEPRPLSAIGEDVNQTPSPAAAAPPPSTTNPPGLLPRTSSQPNGLPVGPKIGLPRSPRMNGGASGGNNSLGDASLLKPSPAIQPGPTSPHARSISDASVPTIEISDDGASTIKAPNSPPRPATSASPQTPAAAPAAAPQPSDQPTTSSEEESARVSELAKATPGEPNYFPMVHYKLQSIAPGTVLAPAPLKPRQLNCFANHYRFTPSRNEDHPLACQSCSVKDSGMRFTCAHCGVRICPDCRDVLMMNGRDLNKLLEMLKA